MTLSSVVLKKDKEKSLQRFHPWVFSGAIQKIISDNETVPEDGDIVEVLDNKNNFLAIGYFSYGSIAVRVLSFYKIEINIDFWKQKLKGAYDLRKELGLTNSSLTNIYRLVHGEGDGLPGLIIDYYNGNIVIQSHSIGVHKAKKDIVKALKEIYPKERLNTIYDKSAETMAKHTDVLISNCYLYQQTEKITTIGEENSCKYHLDWVNGQKTGFFIDQRENRLLLANYAKNKHILNTFCYSGGFSVAALKNGAKHVVSVDSSEKAIDLTKANIELNGFENHKAIVSDTVKFLNENKNNFDIIVLDPPAYAKHKKSKHNAIQGYRRINEIALKQINKGGLLFTFSCSQVISRKLFYDTIIAAAISAKRNIRVLHHLSQPADHPINIYHPEGEYLKGLVLYVD